MKLSIIIVSWNTRELLGHCLESLVVDRWESLSGGAELFVVDNASTDGSPAMVRERYPQVKLIENPTNVGYAQANNQAIEASRGHYILLLNPDTVVRSGALEALVRFMDDHPEAGAAGARLLNPDGSVQPSCHPSPTLSRELWWLFHLDRIVMHAHYAMERWDVGRPRDVDIASGACLILRASKLQAVGLLDDAYFMYSEEVDLCRRISRAGGRIYWVPEASVVHYGGQSTRHVADRMFLQLYQSKVQYYRKHDGRTAAQLYKVILFAASCVRLALSPIARLERPAERQRHLALARNYRRLIAELPTY